MLYEGGPTVGGGGGVFGCNPNMCTCGSYDGLDGCNRSLLLGRDQTKDEKSVELIFLPCPSIVLRALLSIADFCDCACKTSIFFPAYLPKISFAYVSSPSKQELLFQGHLKQQQATPQPHK
jgi:hypothetical protein